MPSEIASEFRKSFCGAIQDDAGNEQCDVTIHRIHFLSAVFTGPRTLASCSGGGQVIFTGEKITGREYGIMRPTSYADSTQRAAFAAWLESERVRTGTSKVALAAAIGEEGTTRVNRFLSGRTLPVQKTLRRICDAMDVPWFEAFANAGYYREILELLAALVRLGDQWGIDDEVYPSIGSELFRQVGILRIRGQAMRDALTDMRLAGRYVVGGYSEAEQYHVSAIVPKPVAIALFVGCGGFIRRGDVYKDGRSGYAAEALSAARSIVDDASGVLAGPLPLLLEAADAVLKRTAVPFGLRRVAAGEYVTEWCVRECQAFAHFARLAIFARWGEAGSSLSSVTAYTVMPEIRVAECPELETYR